MAGEITAEQAARILGYNTDHLYRLFRDGTIKARKVGRKVWLVERVEVERARRRKAEKGRIYKDRH